MTQLEQRRYKELVRLQAIYDSHRGMTDREFNRYLDLTEPGLLSIEAIQRATLEAQLEVTA